MDNLPELNSDRREFFRITDSVFIEHSLLNTAEVEKLIPNIQNNIRRNDSRDSQRISSIQTNLNHLIDTINQTDRDIARALRLLDEKSTLPTKSTLKSNDSSDQHPYIDANLSAGGIAFYVNEDYPVKSALEVHIEFRSSSIIIHAIAHVISHSKSSEAPKETPYLLRLVFSHMNAIDRNLLVKHTLSRQALYLRLNKDKTL
jgi:hypothetical protein